MSYDLEDIISRMPNVKEITAEDLGEHAIEDIKCRACSGYGNCGYKAFRVYNGRPYSICSLELGKITGDDSDAY